MIIQFETQHGVVLERSDQKKVVEGALPTVIQAEEGSYWFIGVRLDREIGWMPAYMLAREVSAALH